METIKVQYTDPNNGLDKLDTFRFDLLKYRKDESEQPVENFFFSSAATGVSSLREIPDMLEASIVANPFNPYACSANPVIYGIVKTAPIAHSLELTDNPLTLGFAIGAPIAILTDFADTTPIATLIPTDVTSSTLVFAEADSISTLGIKINFVIVKMAVPMASVPSFTKENSDWGVKALLEKPGTPVLDAFFDAGSIKVTITPPTTGAYVIEKYNVYVISATNESTFDMTDPIIHGSRKPDLILSPGDLTSKPVSTWKGGTNAGGGTITSGNYYVVVVARDVATAFGGNTSSLSNVEYVTFT
jgi:hypothetical protein